MHNRRDLELILRSGTPIVVIETTDERRFLETLVALTLHSPAAAYRPLMRWSVTDGLQRLDLDLQSQPQPSDPADVLRQIREAEHPAVYALLDFHPFLADPVNVRLLKDIAIDAANTGVTILLISGDRRVGDVAAGARHLSHLDGGTPLPRAGGCHRQRHRFAAAGAGAQGTFR